VRMPNNRGDLVEGMERLGLEGEGINPVLAVPRPTPTPMVAAAAAAEEDQRKQQQQQQALVFAQKCRELFEPDEEGDTQLHLAIASSHYDVADTLIRLCPSPVWLCVQNRQSYSPLHIAVLQNQPQVVRALVVAGASIFAADREGNTPLHMAAVRGYLECGEALIKPIAVAEMSGSRHTGAGQQAILANHRPEGVVDRCNYYGEQCVHLAAMGGHCRFLQFLCWNNADMNAQEGRGGRTALHFAVGAKSMEAAHCLVEPRPFGCGVDPMVPDWCGKTAAAMARANRSQNIFTYLVGQSPSGGQEEEESTYCSEFESDNEDNFNIVLDSSFA